jgi:hypothetical protein
MSSFPARTSLCKGLEAFLPSELKFVAPLLFLVLPFVTDTNHLSPPSLLS